jgi:hypothetical protein
MALYLYSATVFSRHVILIIRLRQPNRKKIHQPAMHAMKQFKEKDWTGLLIVMRDAVQSSWRIDDSEL